MPSPPIPNQNTVQDLQNFEIDIEAIYKDFIEDIDSVRSIVSTQFGNNQNFQKKTAGVLTPQNKIETSPQESRCHAFFRLIGFPIISANYDYYSPGYDIVGSEMKKNGLIQQIDFDSKIRIANNPIENFQALSQQREIYINRFYTIFSQNRSIDASTLALSSGAHIRGFADHFQIEDPFDMSPISQTYIGSFESQIGKLSQISLLDYVDQSGNKPTASNLQINRYHFIKPFIVDARIDFNVPNSKKVAVPFTFNKSNLLIGEETYVRRPLIEKVIRDRLFLKDQAATLGSADQSIRDYILGVPSVKDDALIQQMISGNIYKLTEQQQFNKYLRIIGAMVVKLVGSQLDIQKAQSLYYWLPVPSTIGPEGGVGSREIIISESLPSDYLTETDKDLITAILKQKASQFNVQATENGIESDIGNFAFDSFSNTFDNTTSTSLGSIIDQTVRELQETRKHDLDLAGNALRDIEIIMGEFSGFGFCDIIAIIGALYILPIEDLVAFLDSDAYSRMVKILNLKDPPNQTEIESAMKNLTQRVRDFYNLMDALYLAVKNKKMIS